MNELKDIAEFVRSQPPFDLLPEDELQSLCREMEISYQRSGKIALRHGDSNRELHLIRRGAVTLHDADGQLVAKRGEGRLFGYPSLLTGKPVQLEARIAEDTLLYHLPAECFHQLRQRHPSFDQFFSAKLVERLQRARAARQADAYFQESVEALMSAPALTINETVSIHDAAKRMADAGASSLVVVATAGADQGSDQATNEVRGIVTDRDLRNRVLAADLDTTQPIATVMTADPITIDPSISAMDALLLMTDQSIHHLPVVEGASLRGIITLSDLFSALNRHPVYFTARIRKQSDSHGVAEVARQRLDLLAELIEMGSSAEHIGKIMTSITDAATRRLVELATQELGPPPLDFAWLAFGSQARREQSGRTDQDNGLIFSAEPNSAQAEYFAELAQRVCDGLHACGFVHCPGNVMASNPQWRLSLTNWQRQFACWVDEPEPKPLMYASIFFDLRCIVGNGELVRELQQFVLQRAQGNTIFLSYMAGNSLSYQPPLGFFRQFTLESDGEHQDGLNLKQRGVVPIVSLARLHALEQGLTSPETWRRLDAPDNSNLSNLRDALDVISDVRLQHQLKQHRAGQEPTNLVNPAELTPLTRRNLKAAFVVVVEAQKVLRQRYPIT